MSKPSKVRILELGERARANAPATSPKPPATPPPVETEAPSCAACTRQTFRVAGAERRYRCVHCEALTESDGKGGWLLVQAPTVEVRQQIDFGAEYVEGFGLVRTIGHRRMF